MCFLRGKWCLNIQVAQLINDQRSWAKIRKKGFQLILMLMIFAVSSSFLKGSLIESVFITVAAWKHLHWLTGIAVFAPDEPLNSWEHKGGVESNRLSTCIESTLTMSRNDFNVSNRLVSKRPNSVSCNVGAWRDVSEKMTQNRLFSSFEYQP